MPVAMAMATSEATVGYMNPLPLPPQSIHYQLASRLHWLFGAVMQTMASSVCVLQAWVPVNGNAHSGGRCLDGSQTYAQLEFTLQAEPHVALLSDARFQEFRMRSCTTPLQFKNSVCGRVFRTGACQILQNLRLVPPTMHPRSYLKEELLDSVSEVLYIPVYDQLRPGVGPVTVLEALLAAHSPHSITSADLLSFVSASLGALQLSVSNPLPQPVKRSALCGRRARAPVDSDSDMQQHQQQRAVPDVAMVAADVQQQQQRHVMLQRVAATSAHPPPSQPACPAVSSGAADATANMDVSLVRPAISSPATGLSHAAAHGQQHEAQSGLQRGPEAVPCSRADQQPHCMGGMVATTMQQQSGAGSTGHQQYQQQQRSEEAAAILPRKVRRVGQGALVRTKSMYIFNTTTVAGNPVAAGSTDNTQPDQHIISIQAAAAAAAATVVSAMTGIEPAQCCPGIEVQPAAVAAALPAAVALPSATLCPVTAALG